MRALAVILCAIAFPGTVAGQAAVPIDTLRLSLEDAVARALTESEEIATARAQLAQAEAQVTQATAGAFPQVSAGLTYNRAVKTIFDDFTGPPPVEDADIPPAFDTAKTPVERYDLLSELMTRDFMSAMFAGLPFGRKNTYFATFQFAQPLYVGGKVGAALRAARHFRSAANSSLDEAEADVIWQVRSAYLNAALAARVHEIAVQSRDVARAHYRQVELFHNAGTASEFDLLRARVEVENRDPAVVESEHAADLALLELKRLTNIPLDQPLALTTHLEPEMVEVSDDQIQLLVRQRPVLLAAQDMVAVREQAVKIAKGDRLPTVSLVGTMGFQAFPENAAPPGFDEWRKDWNVALAFTWTPFDGFRTRGRIQEAQAQLRLAHLEEAQLREALDLELSAALAEYRNARAQIRARGETVRVAERTLELAEVRFANGLSTQLEVSDAALLLDQARFNEAQSLFDYGKALAHLERLSGGKLTLFTEAREP